jgi:hypothetical protein
LAILLAVDAKAAPQIIYASPDGRGGYSEGVVQAAAKALHVVLAGLPPEEDRRSNVGAVQPNGRPFALPPRPSGG